LHGSTNHKEKKKDAEDKEQPNDAAVYQWMLPKHGEIIVNFILEQRFPNFFERDPNLNLLNASRPMSQTTYDKNN